jgi:colanic acid/amylovoran biosynthesis protein WcaK/AmsJ
MKIAVVNGWHDDNKGDGGIIEATVALVKERIPDAEVSVVSTFTVDHPAYVSAYRHLINRHPTVKVVPSPLPIHHTGGVFGYYGGVVPWVIKMIPELVRLAWGVIGNSPGARAIADADLVISKGGQVFYNNTSHPRDLAHLFKHLYPLILARRAAVPYVVFGQSFGPFKGRLGAAIARLVLNDAKGIFVREKMSGEVLRKIGVRADKVTVIPDVAFWLRPEMTERLNTILRSVPLVEKQFWAITVRTWPTGKSRDDRNQYIHYLEEMRAFISGVLDSNLTSRVLLVVHVFGPIEMEDDRLPTAQLMSMLANLKEKVILIDQDLTPSELVALYGLAGLVVGTRFHSVIFALAGGAPSMAISYFGPKAKGIMAQLEISEMCIDIENFSAADAIRRLTTFTLNPQNNMKERIENYRIQLRTAIDKVLA